MSRSGYDDDYGSDDALALGRYRQAVAMAMKGKRGQKFFTDLVAALDAMPVKRLITEELICSGEVCAIGALGVARGIDMSNIDPGEPEWVGRAFDIAESLAREVVYMNDEAGRHKETPEERWQRVRGWVQSQIAAPQASEEPRP